MTDTTSRCLAAVVLGVDHESEFALVESLEGFEQFVVTRAVAGGWWPHLHEGMRVWLVVTGGRLGRVLAISGNAPL